MTATPFSSHGRRFPAIGTNQDVWFAYLSDQAEAVKEVQNASGAMNDAKVEILGHMTADGLREHGVPNGAVKKGTNSPAPS